jgi:hypothetical protein
MDNLIEEYNKKRFNECLNNPRLVKELSEPQLKAIQRICYEKLGEMRGQAWEKYKLRMPDYGNKMTSIGIVGTINEIIIAPEFKKELPIIYFKIEGLSEKIRGIFNSKFESLFRYPAHPGQVKEIFETQGYTVNSQWYGITKKDNELLAAYHALRPILKPGNTTAQAKIFYHTFGLTVGKNNTNKGEYITDRHLRNTPLNAEIERFERIFIVLLSKAEISEDFKS